MSHDVVVVWPDTSISNMKSANISERRACETTPSIMQPPITPTPSQQSPQSKPRLQALPRKPGCLQLQDQSLRDPSLQYPSLEAPGTKDPSTISWGHQAIAKSRDPRPPQQQNKKTKSKHRIKKNKQKYESDIRTTINKIKHNKQHQ